LVGRIGHVARISVTHPKKTNISRCHKAALPPSTKAAIDLAMTILGMAVPWKLKQMPAHGRIGLSVP
jgi:hypothetical protein